MKIDEAIKILTEMASGADIWKGYENRDAIQLGIAALKRVQDVRRFPEASNWKPLPGETEEVK